jgi:cell division FtsZ-interacting protein ZapD
MSYLDQLQAQWDQMQSDVAALRIQQQALVDLLTPLMGGVMSNLDRIQADVQQILAGEATLGQQIAALLTQLGTIQQQLAAAQAAGSGITDEALAPIVQQLDQVITQGRTLVEQTAPGTSAGTTPPTPPAAPAT